MSTPCPVSGPVGHLRQGYAPKTCGTHVDVFEARIKLGNKPFIAMFDLGIERVVSKIFCRPE